MTNRTGMNARIRETLRRRRGLPEPVADEREGETPRTGAAARRGG